MSKNKNKKSLDKTVQTLEASLVKNQTERLETISNFFENFENNDESVKFLFEVQKCTFTSDRFKALDSEKQENLQVWLPTLMEFVMELGMLNGKAELLTENRAV